MQDLRAHHEGDHYVHYVHGEAGKLDESPPVKISHGTATNVGLGLSAAALIPVVIDFLSNDAIDNATRRLLIVVGAGLAAIVIVGRMWQANTAEKTRGAVTPLPVIEGVALTSEERAKYEHVIRQLEVELQGRDLKDTDADADGAPQAFYGDDVEAHDPDGDAFIGHEGGEVIVAGGGPDDDHDLHDRHDVPARIKKAGQR